MPSMLTEPANRTSVPEILYCDVHDAWHKVGEECGFCRLFILPSNR